MEEEKQLLGRLNSLRRAGRMCDVKIYSRLANGSTVAREFYAHIAVLAAASPHFMNMFNSGFKETIEREVTLDMDEDIVDMLLEYMYTCNIPIDESIAPRLLPEASYLHLDKLKERCAKLIEDSVVASNCLELWTFASLYNCEKIRERAWKTACENLDRLIDTPDFVTLAKADLLTLLADPAVCCRESNVFLGVCNWVRADPDRKQHMKGFLGLVRLSCLERKFLVDVVGKEPLVSDDKECFNIFYNALTALVLTTPDSCSDRVGVRQRRKWKASGGWRDGPQLINSMLSCSAVVHNDKIYCAAGTMNVYTNGGWRPIASPSRECLWKLCVIGGLLFATGVRSHNRYVYKYEEEGNLWILVYCGRRMSSDLVSLTVLDDKICVAVKRSQTIEAFDPQHPDLGFARLCGFPDPGPTQTFALCTVDASLAVVGGWTNGNGYCDEVQVYDAGAQTWRKHSALAKARSHLAVTQLDGSLIVAGGYAGEALGDVEILRGHSRTQLPRLAPGRYDCGLVLLDKVLYAIGGMDAGNFVQMLDLEEDND